VTVSGSISPTVSSGVVVLTYVRPDGTTLTRATTIGTDGSYSDTYMPDTIGAWSVNAYWLGDPTHDGATSSMQSFNVNERTPCMILLAFVIALVCIILVLIRRRGRRARLLGLILIVIALLVYYIICHTR
ncbi:MAG: Ig-like domain-containing protein, partial [Candidatus Bathyarchaeia archaeon]